MFFDVSVIYKGLIADTRLWLEVSCLRFGLGAEVLPLTCRICCGALNCGGTFPFGFLHKGWLVRLFWLGAP